MSRRSLFALLALCFFAAPLRATGDIEAKITNSEGAPKMQGTTGVPLRLIPGAGQTQGVPAGGDVKTYDGPTDLAPATAEGVRIDGAEATVVPHVRLVSPGAQVDVAADEPADELPVAGAHERSRTHQKDNARAELGEIGDSSLSVEGGEAPATSEEAAAVGARFDGQIFKTVASGVVTDTRLGRLWDKTAGRLGRGVKGVIKKRFEGLDAYGGPKEVKLGLKEKIGFGAKWGLNMVGLGALIQGASLLIAKVFTWQLHVSDSVLGASGRVELLAGMGPKAMNAAVTSHPWHFLFVDMPKAVFWEEFGQLPSLFGPLTALGTEFAAVLLLLKGAAYAAREISQWPSVSRIKGVLEKISRWSNKKAIFAAAVLTYLAPLHIGVAGLAFPGLGSRLLGFGLTWSVLAAVRPVALRLARWLRTVPDVFGLRHGAQKMLAKSGYLSKRAFPIAAFLSAAAFAANHFAAWGVKPELIAVQGTLATILAYTAYKTRSVLVPFVAHYTYNLLTLGAAVLAAHFLLPTAALAYTYLLGTAALFYLFFQFRSYQKARRQEEKEQHHANLLSRYGKVVLPLLLAALSAGTFMGSPRVSTSVDDAVAVKAAQVWPAQDTTKTEERPAAPTAAAVDSAAPAGAPAAQPVKISLAQALDAINVSVIAKAKPAVVKIFSGHGLGSGYIISADGIVISNAHVTGAAKVGDILDMEFADGSHGKITVLAFNHNKDIAILQLPKKDGGWPFIPLGDSDKSVEGQNVIAMGYPLGLPFTATKGIISGIGHGRGSIYVQQMQTDAAINHGNSGGALITMNGEVVAMNTAIAAPTPESGSIGIGFSITSNDIKAALAQYESLKNLYSTQLGIIVNQGNPEAPQGVLIDAVRKGSPAAQAGIRAGDLILGVDKARFGEGPALENFGRILAHHQPGDKIVILVSRNGDANPVTVTLSGVEK